MAGSHGEPCQSQVSHCAELGYILSSFVSGEPSDGGNWIYA